MTDETTVAPDTADQTTETQTETQGDPELGDAGKRAIEAERSARKAAEQQAKALTEQLEAATLRASAFEAANTDLTNTVTTREQELTRLKVGLAKGLPPSLVDRLRGDDEAALTADADSLLALLPQATVPAPPRPDPTQGSRGPSTTDPATEFGAFLQRARNRS